MQIFSVELPRRRDGTPVALGPIAGAELVILVPGHTPAWRVPMLHDVWLELDDERLPRPLSAAPPLVAAHIGVPLSTLCQRALEQGGLEVSAAAFVALELFEAFEHLHKRELSIAMPFERHTFVDIDGGVQLFAPIERNGPTMGHAHDEMHLEEIEEAVGVPVALLDLRMRAEPLRLQLTLLGRWLVEVCGGEITAGRISLPSFVPREVSLALEAAVAGKHARVRTHLRVLAGGDAGRRMLRTIVNQLFPEETAAILEWREQIAMLS